MYTHDATHIHTVVMSSKEIPISTYAHDLTSHSLYWKGIEDSKLHSSSIQMYVCLKKSPTANAHIAIVQEVKGSPSFWRLCDI